MNVRKIIISLIGLALIALGFFGKEKMASKEKPVRPKEAKTIPTVFTQIVKNGDNSITITASGNLAARDRIEIYSEVQGIFENSAHQFKPGVYYKSGELLLSLNSDEARSNLRSQKSNLYNQVVSILPELKFDYPEAFQKWKDYASNFDIEKRLTKLPESSSERENLFIVGKNISSSWYTVKNSEERIAKYSLYAPFNGILIEANVDKGALVRPGFKVGEFINPSNYELEVAVSSSFAEYLKVGNSVNLQNVEKTKTWNGKVTRVNSLIDPNTQTIQAFIRVSGKGLREGMYLEANLAAKNEGETFEVSRKNLVDNNKIFVYNDGKLMLKEITPVHFTDKTAIVKGLADGTEILEKMLPGAYDGIVVNKFSEVDKK